MAAKHSNFQILRASMEQLRALILDRNFATVLNIELKSENPSPTGLWYRFHHGTTFTSWGEKITITLTPVSECDVRVDILSECGMPTQVIDWGKNRKNVDTIFRYMMQNLPRFAHSANSGFAPAHQSAPPVVGKKFCHNCGNPLPAETRFCTNCGAQQN